jgi:predicted MPP superfamily phosphohydrolase
MIYFIIFLLALGNLFFWWWADRRLRIMPRGMVLRVLLAGLVGGQTLVLGWWIAFPGTLRGLGNAFWKPVTAWLYMWHLLVLPATLVVLLFGYSVLGLGRLFTRLAGLRWPKAGVVAASEAPLDDHVLDPVTGPAVVYPSRRQLLAAAATFVPQVALAGTLLEAAHQHGKFRIREMEVKLPQLPQGLDGLTLAHVSDTHTGRFVGPKELDAIVEATANLKPDLIVFTGDLIDFNLVDLPPALAAMRQLAKVAPMAMCVGNHDLFDDGVVFRNKVRRAEVGLMVDEMMPLHVRGHRIDLLGLDWGTAVSSRQDGIALHMRKLLERRRMDAFPILLAHHPHAFDPAAAAGIPLTLSGHTHGGQIMLTKNWGCGRLYKYWSGLYEKGPNKLVVSNGVGNWFPLRINAPAEIIRLRLRRG